MAITSIIFRRIPKKPFKLWLAAVATNSSVDGRYISTISTSLWDQELTNDLRKDIEDYWFERLKYDNLFDDAASVSDKTTNYYALTMFPYPSGHLHMGHARVYSISDSFARYHRLQGKNVFHPMGWDSFGLPAENAAIEHGVKPEEWTSKNIAQMRKQLDMLKCTFDWNKEVMTSSPSYYKWTQYLFLKMFDAGLVYQKKAMVNWDPVDRTVLADEQVDDNGRSWRSGAIVEKKVLKQWFIRTTKFSHDLFDGLNDKSLSRWYDVVDIQKNWIGECDGYSFDLKLEGELEGNDNSLNIWLRNPVDILRVEFVIVKPNSLIDLICNGCGANGLLPVRAINPFTGRTIPLYVSSDVPFSYYRDTYVGIPAISSFDHKFAVERLQLQTVGKTDSNSACSTSYSAEQICEDAQKLGIGGYAVSSKLKDWLISRQRYWGTPIPIVHCDKCGGPQPVPYDQLPVTLPNLPDDCQIDKGLHDYLKSSKWVRTTCPNCGDENGRRETDTMDTFVDSSWYYLRYTDVNNENEPFDRDKASRLMPVDTYVGGKEHAAMHLYYARFVWYFLRSIGYIEDREPFNLLLCQGMVKGKTYKTEEGQYLTLDKISSEGDVVKSKETGEILIETWEKMSKSKYNGVDPDEFISQYGVDTCRLFLSSSVSPRSHLLYDENTLPDVLKWQHKLWLTIREFLKVRQNSLPPKEQQRIVDMDKEETELRQIRNSSIREVTYSYSQSQQLGTAAKIMRKLTTVLRRASRTVRKYSSEYEKSLASLIIMLSPITPHFAATLWFGFTSAPGRINAVSDAIKWDVDVTQQKWPKFDRDFAVPVYCRCNNGPIHEVYVPSYLIPSLTLDQMIIFMNSHPKLHKFLQRSEILETQITRYDNLCADCFMKTRLKEKPNEEASVAESTKLAQ